MVVAFGESGKGGVWEVTLSQQQAQTLGYVRLMLRATAEAPAAHQRQQQSRRQTAEKHC